MDSLTANNNESVSAISEWDNLMTSMTNKNNYGYYRNKSEVHYGPPPNWNKEIPNHTMEVFVGALPRDVNIHELVVLIEGALGENSIYELSIMIDLTQNINDGFRNRGFAFVTFQTKDYATKCREILDNKELRPGKRMRINPSTPNLHLFVANVPSSKSREDILRDLREYTDGLKDVIVFAAKNNEGEMDTKRHRGFVFLEYDTHASAATARKKLARPGFRLWNRELKVDWAAKKHEPSQEVMARVKSLYIRNLTADCSDENLRDYYSKFGEIDNIKKVRDFAFVHFKNRQSALQALEETNKTVLSDNLSNGTIDVELVRPNIHPQVLPMRGGSGMPPFYFPFPGLMGPPPPHPLQNGTHNAPPGGVMPPNSSGVNNTGTPGGAGSFFPPHYPPYGLPFPPPPHGHHNHHHPHHMLPPPHLMYGPPAAVNSPYFPFNKSKQWNFLNGSGYKSGGIRNHNRKNAKVNGNKDTDTGAAAVVGASGDSNNVNSNNNNNGQTTGPQNSCKF